MFKCEYHIRHSYVESDAAVKHGTGKKDIQQSLGMGKWYTSEEWLTDEEEVVFGMQSFDIR